MIVLASASPRRTELLRQIGCSFRCQPSEAEEDNCGEGILPEDLVIKNALAKAGNVASKKIEIDAAVLGADTVVVLDGRVIGKPRDAADAVRLLRMLSGREHDVYTGVALIYKDRRTTGFAKTTVRLAGLSEAEIAAYVASGEPLDKAGAYGIQGIAAQYVEEIRGSYTNVVGLPLCLVRRLCNEVGVRLT